MAGDDGRSRVFIDETLADTARAGATVAFLHNPHDFEPALPPEKWQVSIQAVGSEVAALRWSESGGSDARAVVALADAAGHGWNSLSADVLQVVATAGADAARAATQIQDAYFATLALGDTEADLSGITLVNCLIQDVSLDLSAGSEKLPTLRACMIGRLDGAAEGDLPANRFLDCDIQEFVDQASTTSGLLALKNLPVPTRVMLIVLKKLYFQRGAGRKDSALIRGLGPDTRAYVDAVLKLLVQEGLVHRSRGRASIWIPDRSQTGRVRQLV